jgi:hypothetical protein
LVKAFSMDIGDHLLSRIHTEHVGTYAIGKEIRNMQQQAEKLTLREQGKAWLATLLQQGRARVTLLWQKMKPEPTDKPKQQQRRHQRTWVDQVIDAAFLVVTSLAFLVFLMASLPHVAYFVVTFEPQNPDGSISDWWWTVAYLIAGAINITEFLLSVKFARDVRNATRGLPWYQKCVPTLTTVLKYWPFIILISGFSWAANLQHAEEFHSSMLATAESVNVILPFFQGKTWGDLNPYIVSAYPLLNIAYTFMFDSSRSSDLQPESEHDANLKSVSVIEDDPNLKSVSVSDFAQLLQAMQAMQASQLQVMQEMQRESLKVTVETLHQLAGAKGSQRPPRLKSGEKKSVVTAKRSGSAYEEPIKALWLKNPRITSVEAGQKVGCSHVTAAAILKSLRAVKVTQVEPGDPGESESIEGETA